ncbi:MAG: hypothetical protein Q4P29_05015 [Tissierellia bacterium]|nr:hypothetical protein [Tissierellia bacterium]
MRKKNIFLLLGVILVALIYNLLGNYIKEIFQKPVEMKLNGTVRYDGDIENFQLTENGIISWDGNFLKFASLQGEMLNEIASNGYDSTVRFENGETFFLDKQLNALYVYNDFGQLKNKIALKGSVFNVKKLNDKIYLHKKDNSTGKDFESIWTMNYDGNENKIYETEGYIINFFAKGSTLYAIEISTDFYGYSTSVIVSKGENRQRFEFNNEAILHVAPLKNRIMVITDKKLYAIKGEKKEGIEINEIKDFIIEDDKVAILHGDSLEFYSEKLKSLEKHLVGIGHDRLFSFDNGYFVYGPTEMLGFVGEAREFTYKFESLVKDIKTENRILAAMFREHIELYTLEPIVKGEEETK